MGIYKKVYYIWRDRILVFQRVLVFQKFRWKGCRESSSQHLSKLYSRQNASFRHAVDPPRHIWERRRDLLHEVLLRVRFQAAFLA